jgi:hypothetical protein
MDRGSTVFSSLERSEEKSPNPTGAFDARIDASVRELMLQGQQVFRFETLGDEAFWGDTLQLHRAIEGSKHGGVGPGVSPKTALLVGLKVDVDNDSLAPGIGHRLDRWANRDLKVGAIVSLAPDLSAFTKLLGVEESMVKKVLASLGTQIRRGAASGRKRIPPRPKARGGFASSGLRTRLTLSNT